MTHTCVWWIECSQTSFFTHCPVLTLAFDIAVHDEFEAGPGGGGAAGGQDAAGIAGDEESRLALKTPFVELRQAFMNEKLAPELLYYKAELVHTIKGLLEQQLDLIDDTDPDVVGGGTSLVVSLWKMEHDRIDFMLKSYLRVRLQKIERYVLHYGRSDDDDVAGRLSHAERVCEE